MYQVQIERGVRDDIIPPDVDDFRMCLRIANKLGGGVTPFDIPHLPLWILNATLIQMEAETIEQERQNAKAANARKRAAQRKRR